MAILFLPSAFVGETGSIDPAPPDYWYEGNCPQTGAGLRLPRTHLIEEIARGLMRQLAIDPQFDREGKMYGVLLVETPDGEQRVLKAFSGLLNGNSSVEDWVPPIPGRDRLIFEETRTLAILEALKQDLIHLQSLPQREQYIELNRQYESQRQHLQKVHQDRKLERQQQRQFYLKNLHGSELEAALTSLDEQSRKDGIQRRKLKQHWHQVLDPLKQAIAQADDRIRLLKRQRKELSRQLQAQMQAAYWLTNFAGQSQSLQLLMPGGIMPTGTGDCCAPKLLHYAAMYRLKPLAMAEFWWGPTSPDGERTQGAFYGACTDRCQPLMGFLLSGLPQVDGSTQRDNLKPFPIVYEDEWLIVVDKPAGLLSVPGRSLDRQDCVLHRLRQLRNSEILPVHRLDQETSGVLLLAKHPQTYRQLSQQFQQRTVQKVYEAVLAGVLCQEEGTIALPLGADPDHRPYQKVDWQRGKPCLTHFRVTDRTLHSTRVEFFPVTGRTHQLRVHAADPEGLGVPILGDRLYGQDTGVERLHLHARELHFNHPQSGDRLHLRVAPSF